MPRCESRFACVLRGRAYDGRAAGIGDDIDRAITLVLLRPDGSVVGALPPFVVTLPHLPEIAPIIERCRALHGIDVTILRILHAAPADPRGNMGGPVTFTAEVERDPAATVAWTTPLPDDPLRARWARPGGPALDLGWADEQLAAAGRPRRGPAVQRKTWNLSSIWRIPTARGDVWLKAVPPFFAHEGAVMNALAAPTLPPLIAFDAIGRTLMEDVTGVDQYVAPSERHGPMIDALVALQAGAVGRADELVALGAPDWRAGPFAIVAADVVARGSARLDASERRTLDALVAGLDQRFRALAECGIPDTFVHGDFHTGNVRWTDEGPVIFDWGDLGVGNPLFDMPAFDRNLDDDARPAARARWILRWGEALPGCDPARAVSLIVPIAALRLAIIYQRFLDGIEQTERFYHEDDVPQQLRDAARLAAAEERYIPR